RGHKWAAVRRARAKKKSRVPAVEKVAWHKLGARTRVLLPVGYKLPSHKRLTFRGAGTTVRVYARKFSQGNAAYVEIIPGAKMSGPPRLHFAGRPVRLARRTWGYRGFFPLSPFRKPGRYALKLEVGKSKSQQATFTIRVHKTKF